MRTFLVAIAAVVAMTAATAQPSSLNSRSGNGKMPVPLLDQAGVPPIIANNGGRVLNIAPAPGGMTAYTVEKDGKPVIFYLTPDRSSVFVGVLFDAQTGKNLSDAFVERSQALVGRAGQRPAEVADGTRPAPAGSTDPALAMHLSSSIVFGVTEGSATPAKTTFVFFDPRCPYCHNLYRNTRTAVGRGASVKWIPVNTLGDPGVPLSAAILRQGAPTLARVSLGTQKTGVEPSMTERANIEANTKLFQSLVAQIGKQPATPTIMFSGPNGRLSVVQDDGSNKAALAAAFGG